MQKEFLTPHIVLEMFEWSSKVMQLAQHEKVTTTTALGEGMMILA
jgi:hypothetical protein